MHACMHACMRAWMHVWECVCPCVHPSVRPCVLQSTSFFGKKPGLEWQDTWFFRKTRYLAILNQVFYPNPKLIHISLMVVVNCIQVGECNPPQPSCSHLHRIDFMDSPTWLQFILIDWLIGLVDWSDWLIGWLIGWLMSYITFWWRHDDVMMMSYDMQCSLGWVYSACQILVLVLKLGYTILPKTRI